MRKVFVSAVLTLMLGISTANGGKDATGQTVVYTDDKGNPIDINDLRNYIPLGEEGIPVGEELIPAGSGNEEAEGKEEDGEVVNVPVTGGEDEECDWCKAKGHKGEQSSPEGVEVPAGNEEAQEESAETTVPSVDDKGSCGCESGVCGSCGHDEEAGQEEENIEVVTEQPAGQEEGTEESVETPAVKEKDCDICGGGDSGDGVVIVITAGDCTSGNCSGDCASGNCGGHNGGAGHEEENVEVITEQPVGQEETAEESAETPVHEGSCGCASSACGLCDGHNLKTGQEGENVEVVTEQPAGQEANEEGKHSVPSACADCH